MKHPSVLAPLRPLIRSWLAFRFETKNGAREILANPLDVPDFGKWFQVIAPTGRNSSKYLWKWRIKEVIADKNSSEEKIMEKAVARYLPKEEWANQIVTASGLSHDRGDGHRNIDLINRTGPDRYRFIELKIKSNNPVYAAVELLEYALLYWWARQHPETHKSEREDKEVLSARHIDMEILAPIEFYTGYDVISLRKFAGVLTTSFNRLTQGHLKIKFRFAVFVLPPKPVTWDRRSLEAALSSPREL